MTTTEPDDLAGTVWVPRPDTTTEVTETPREHPFPGARPGDLLARGATYSVLAYDVDGTVVAAVYYDGRLLRRDGRGWWVAGALGKRTPVADQDVAALIDCVPASWPILAEQAPLATPEVGS